MKNTMTAFAIPMNAQSGEFEIHAAGCKDLRNPRKRHDYNLCRDEEPETVEAVDADAAAKLALDDDFGDFDAQVPGFPEGSFGAAGFRARILPCARKVGVSPARSVTHMNRATIGAPDVPAVCGIQVASPDRKTRRWAAVTCDACRDAERIRLTENDVAAPINTDPSTFGAAATAHDAVCGVHDPAPAPPAKLTQGDLLAVGLADRLAAQLRVVVNDLVAEEGDPADPASAWADESRRVLRDYDLAAAAGARIVKSMEVAS